MKGRQVVLGRHFGGEAAALMVDGQLQDLLFDLSGLTPLPPGSVCRAVVDRLVKGQGGVFVRLPEGERGFLRDAKGLSEGQTLIVQVSGVADDGKAIPCTQRVIFRGQTALATPGAPGVNVSRRIRDDAERERLVALGEAALASALAKIANAAGRTVNIPAERNPASASMFIINPLGALRMDRLFSTHPSTQERIDLLARMQVAPAAPSFARSSVPPVRRG